MRTLLHAAFSRSIATAAPRVALVVGTVLINPGPATIAGRDPCWMHLALNFIMPHRVASYSDASVKARRGDRL